MSDDENFEHSELLTDTLNDIHNSVLNSDEIKPSTNWKSIPLTNSKSLLARRKPQVYLAAISILLVLATGAGVVIGSINEDSNSSQKIKTVDKVKTATSTTTTSPSESTTSAPTSTTVKPRSSPVGTSKSGTIGNGDGTNSTLLPAITLNPITETTCGYGDSGPIVTNPYFTMRQNISGSTSIKFFKPFTATFGEYGKAKDTEKTSQLNSTPLNRETLIVSTFEDPGTSYHLELSFNDSVHSGGRLTTVIIGSQGINSYWDNVSFSAGNDGNFFNFYSYPSLGEFALSQYFKYFGTNSLIPTTWYDSNSNNLTPPWSGGVGYNATTSNPSYSSISASTFSPQSFPEGYAGCQIYLSRD